MDHRRILALACAAVLWGASPRQAHAQAAAARPSDFPHVILNNDMTNWTLFAPGKDAATRADVPEVVSAFKASLAFGLIPGVDAQSLSVLYSTFPFWHSKLYSPQDHDAFLRGLAFYRSTASQAGFPGLRESPMRRLLDSGNDLVRVFQTAPLTGADGRPQQKILNVRVNDAHYTHFYDLFARQTREELIQDAEAQHSEICDSKSVAGVDAAENWAQTAFTGYFAGFKTGKLPPNLDNRCVAGLCLSARNVQDDCGSRTCVITIEGSRCPTVVLSFLAPSVRRFKLMQIEELVGLYKPETVELDFNRFPAYFPAEVPGAQRRDIMSGWLRELRTRLDAIRPGLRIGIRVPSRLVHRRAIGIDLAQIGQQGFADYAILGMPYFADQQVEIEAPARASRLHFYAEMTQTSGAVPADKAVLDRFGLAPDASKYWEVPITSRQFVTAANQAYHTGIGGMALFNLQYYLRLAAPVPPLDVPRAAVTCLADARCSASGDQEYTLTTNHYHLSPTPDMLPFKLGGAPSRSFSLRFSPPAGGWGRRGLVSLSLVPQGAMDPAALAAARASLRVQVNGVPLQPSDAAWPVDARDGAATRAHVERLWFLQKPFRLVFGLDASRLVDGENRIDLAWEPGADAASLRIVDFRVFAPAAEGASGAARAH